MYSPYTPGVSYTRSAAHYCTRHWQEDDPAHYELPILLECGSFGLLDVKLINSRVEMSGRKIDFDCFHICMEEVTDTVERAFPTQCPSLQSKYIYIALAQPDVLGTCACYSDKHSYLPFDVFFPSTPSAALRQILLVCRLSCVCHVYS